MSLRPKIQMPRDLLKPKPKNIGGPQMPMPINPQQRSIGGPQMPMPMNPQSAQAPGGTMTTNAHQNLPYETRRTTNRTGANNGTTKTNTGAKGTSTGGTSTGGTGKGGTPSQTTNTQTSAPSELDILKQKLYEMMNQDTQYNPENDPMYQSLLALSEKQANKAGTYAMEQMNDRGILNSTITGDRIAQIQQDAQDNVEGMIPQLAQMQDSKRNNKYQQLYGMYSTQLGEQWRGKEFGLRQDQFNYQKSTDARNFNYRKQQDSIANALREKAAEAKSQPQGMTYEQSARMETAYKVADALGANSYEEALAIVTNNPHEIAQYGVNISEILEAIAWKFGEPGKKKSNEALRPWHIQP